MFTGGDKVIIDENLVICSGVLVDTKVRRSKTSGHTVVIEGGLC